MTDPSELYRTYDENARNNQIGEGISDEVAADLGYETPEQVHEIVRGLGGIAIESARTDVSNSRIYELPGKNGRMNPIDRIPSRKELLEAVGGERVSQQIINKRGAKRARASLKRAQRRARQA